MGTMNQNNKGINYIFKNPNEISTYGIFMNRVLQTVWNNFSLQTDDILVEIGKFVELDLDIFNQEIFSLIDTEIPLWSYYELKKFGKTDWGFTSDEYETALIQITAACKLYYDEFKFV